MSLNYGLLKPSPNLINFSYSDFASGRGMQLFNGGTVSPSNYIITDNVYYSHDITTTTSQTTGGTETGQQDLDFDTELKLPRIIDGKVLVNVTGGVSTDGTNGTLNVYYKIQVRKWDGSSETVLGTQQSSTWTEAIGGGAVKDRTFAIEVSVTNELIKAGETLRINVEMWGWGPSNAWQFITAHDPMERDDPNAVIANNSPKALKVWIPFKTSI